MKKNHKSLIFISLIAGVLIFTFFYSLGKGMHQTIPEPLNRHVNSLGIAISELKYGLDGYRGYNKAVNSLIDKGISNNQAIGALTDAGILNRAIKESLEIEDVSSAGQYCLFREDKGLIDYYKLAFRLFGYKVESFFYLYFLLLVMPIFIFLITFYRRLDLLQMLLIFVCGHFVITAAAPIVGIELQTVHNSRSLPVLAVLPAIYLALIILGKHRFSRVLLVCAIIQAAILAFVIHARTSAVYQVMFLSFLFGLSVFWFWANNPKLGRYVFKRVIFWPLGLVFIGFFLVKAHLALSLQYPYTSVTEKHYFWYTVYVGLAAHPDSISKYGIEFDDPVAHAVVKKYLVEKYGTVVSYESELVEAVLKQEFFRILRKDPLFVVENYLYKFPLFIKNYFSVFFGAGHYLCRLLLFLIIITGSLLAGEVLLKRWLQYFYLLVLCWAFSFLPYILAMPAPPLIADTALLFTMLIYFLISGGVCYMSKRLLINRK